MNIDECFPSAWMEAAEVDADGVTVTIDDVTLEEVGDEREQKPVLWLEEFSKGMVLNKTNAGTIAGMYGTDTDEWARKKITIYSTETAFKGEMVPCIRVRSKRPDAPKRPSRGRARGNGAEQSRGRRGKRERV
jgi:hypothetical protein